MKTYSWKTDFSRARTAPRRDIVLRKAATVDAFDQSSEGRLARLPRGTRLVIDRVDDQSLWAVANVKGRRERVRCWL